MKSYYVNNNEQINGDHEVHHENCYWLPKPENRTYLGLFDNCKSAVNKATAYHSKVNGCKHCSEKCHTS